MKNKCTFLFKLKENNLIYFLFYFLIRPSKRSNARKSKKKKSHLCLMFGVHEHMDALDLDLGVF